MRTTIRSHERAMVLRDGQPVGWLEPGRSRLWSWWSDLEVKKYNIDAGFAPLTPELACVVPAEAGEELVVPAAHLATLTIDGRPLTVLEPGRYVLWQLRARVEARLHSLQALITSMDPEFWPFVPREYLQVFMVQPFQRGLLLIDGVLTRVLEPGRYGIQLWNRTITLTLTDIREQEVQVVGQEVMTADKVSIRINLLLKYRVNDPGLCFREVANLRDALYAEAQLIARRWIGGLTLDALLERRYEGGEQMRGALHKCAHRWGAGVLQFDIKDIVLPGEMKALLNRVIEAEKQAAANLIVRREETAATRSLANTAKVLQNNPTLLRLRELETWKEIATNIDSITVVAGGGDMLSQLRLPVPEGKP